MKMESGCSKNGEMCPQLLDLIPQEREWYLRHDHVSSSEEKKLELRLGPPGDEDNWSMSIKDTAKNNSTRETDASLISLGYLSSMKSNDKQTHKFPSPEDHHNHHPVGSVLSPSWTKNHHHHDHHSFLQFPSTVAPQSLPVRAQESSQPCCSKVVDIQNAERKPFSPTANAAVPQKRTAPGPVVGWPPIRSFRKNITNNNSSKLVSESPPPPSVLPHKAAKEKAGAGPSTKFVKINMDGVPIGRKVDLKAYNSYEKLSTAVDELFRGLLAAQRNTSGSGGGMVKKQEDEKAITGLLDGTGEYTLVYQDNEGDRMLVGDVPWHMFESTVERLRVLKSSELSALNLGSSKQGKIPV